MLSSALAGPRGGSRNTTRAWFPLYLFCVLAATLFPYWVHCVPGDLDLGAPSAFDIAQNILLFVPLGVALCGRSGVAIIAFSILFSLAIESAQFWILRSPSPWDVLANVLGATLGRGIARFESPRRFARPRIPGWGSAGFLQFSRTPAPDRLTRLALGAAIGLFALSLHAAPRRLGNGFESWDAMPLLIGNELSLERPWRGRLAELALYDRASRQETAWGSEGPPAWRENGPILWMRFQAPVTGQLRGPQGTRSFELLPPENSHARLERDGLVLSGGVWSLPPEVRDHVMQRLKKTGQVSLHARVSPASLDVGGPGRIFSLSRGVSERGFTLGQSGGDLVFRVRTPVTSDNGTRPDARTNFAPLTLSEQRVWASYDGFRSRIEIDGVCHGERILSSKRGVGILGEALGVAIAAGCGLSALAATGWRRREPHLIRSALGCAAAAVFAGGLWWMGAWEHLPFFGPWAFGLVTGATALGVRGGLVLDTPDASTRRNS